MPSEWGNQFETMMGIFVLVGLCILGGVVLLTCWLCGAFS